MTGFRTKAPQDWDNSAFKEYRLQSSDDGSSWTTRNSGDGMNQDCCYWQEITWATTTPAKYWRLYIVNTWTGRWPSIQRLELQTEPAWSACTPT